MLPNAAFAVTPFILDAARRIIMTSRPFRKIQPQTSTPTSVGPLFLSFRHAKQDRLPSVPEEILEKYLKKPGCGLDGTQRWEQAMETVKFPSTSPAARKWAAV